MLLTHLQVGNQSGLWQPRCFLAHPNSRIIRSCLWCQLGISRQSSLTTTLSGGTQVQVMVQSEHSCTPNWRRAVIITGHRHIFEPCTRSRWENHYETSVIVIAGPSFGPRRCSPPSRKCVKALVFQDEHWIATRHGKTSFPT